MDEEAIGTRRNLHSKQELFAQILDTEQTFTEGICFCERTDAKWGVIMKEL